MSGSKNMNKEIIEYVPKWALNWLIKIRKKFPNEEFYLRDISCPPEGEYGMYSIWCTEEFEKSEELRSLLSQEKIMYSNVYSYPLSEETLNEFRQTEYRHTLEEECTVRRTDKGKAIQWTENNGDKVTEFLSKIAQNKNRSPIFGIQDIKNNRIVESGGKTIINLNDYIVAYDDFTSYEVLSEEDFNKKWSVR
jgi:hypothetical protein